MSAILTKIITLPGIIIGLCFHEYAHAAMSNALGDPTPKNEGRLTINPVAHIDIIGFLCLLICGFGWGKPVEIDPRYYKHKRRDEFLVSIAGVVMNLLLAIAFALMCRGVANIYSSNPSELLQTLYAILYYTVMINLCLMIFNLIPCPPLDGWGILTQIFKLDKYQWYYKLYRYGSLILLALILFNVTDFIITPCINVMMNLLLG